MGLDQLLLEAAAQQAVEFAARTLPELRPDPKFVDDAPLYSNPIDTLDSQGVAGAWPLDRTSKRPVNTVATGESKTHLYSVTV